jgi:cytochrome c oxidase accessory protein FixG
LREIEEPGYQEKLSMIDALGHRKFIIPAEVKGFFNKRKKVLHFILLVIFLILPWIQVDGEQAVLLNISARKFHFFGFHLQAHDAPLIFFVLVGLAAGLALATALFGRVWCGWACPQTVFIESLFRQIEIWTEGNYLKRRQLQNEEFSFKKFRKSGLKWILYFIVSFLISHSFLAYWTGSKELLMMVGSTPQDNLFYFGLVSFMTALVLFNFGWFREQFCLIVCPYGKFQSVLLDSHTVNIMYDDKRGEPRKGKVPNGGDCVACGRCVQVCPTGIDIRNGIQMECIGCTACLDACDEIMRKVKKPEGLIRYKALTEKPINWFRGRVVAYAVVFLLSGLGLTWALAKNTHVRSEIIRSKDIPYILREVMGQTWVQNHFIIRIENTSNRDKKFRVTIEDQNLKYIVPENPIVIKSENKKDTPLFIEMKKELLNESTERLEVKILDLDTSEVRSLKFQMVGP